MNRMKKMLTLGIILSGGLLFGAEESEAFKAASTAEISPLLYDFSVQGGKITQKTNGYAAEYISITPDNKILLIHDHNNNKAEYQCLQWRTPSVFDAKSGMFAFEWEVRVVSTQADKPESFMVVIRSGEDKKLARTAVFRVAADFVSTPWGKFPVDASKPIVCRVLQDMSTGDTALYVDGKFIASGLLKTKADEKQRTSLVFGDGSGAVGGRVELGYFKVGEIE